MLVTIGITIAIMIAFSSGFACGAGWATTGLKNKEMDEYLNRKNKE